MVSFTHFIVALSAIAGSLAAPKAEPTLIERDTEKRAPDFELGNRNLLSRRQNYNQDYTTGGDVIYTHTSNGFTVQFDDADDFVVGVGWQPGSAQDITFSGDFEPGTGTILLSIYGWTTNPLVEYYIIEDSLNFSGGTYKGTVTSDGSVYDIYENTRTNEPSILGTSTFNQYISVRQSKRSSGTVTTANHFNAWSSLGLTLGTYNYQIVAGEGYNLATGAITQTVS